MAETKNIPLDLIDDPKLALRPVADDENLQELMTSMRELGLIEPIILRPVAERFEILVGRRRTRAARLLNWQTIRSEIRKCSDGEALAIRLAENLQRLDVDPVDEACFIGEIMLKYHKTGEEVARLLRRSDTWVKERLEVFEMPDYMKEHLKLKKYPLGSALWISRIENEKVRRYYANWAAINGVTVAQAKRWYDRLKASRFVLDGAQEIKVEGPSGEQKTRTVIQCARCGQDCFLDEADSVWIHRVCPTLPEDKDAG